MSAGLCAVGVVKCETLTAKQGDTSPCRSFVHSFVCLVDTYEPMCARVHA